MTQPPVERRRKSWREFRLAYPGIISVLFVLLVSMLAIDGWLVYQRVRYARETARLRAGMTSINAVQAFAAVPALPFGGVGESGFGRIHGEDGLREFARAKAITVRRGPSLLPAMTFERTPAQVQQIVKALRLLYGRKP